MQKYIRKNVQAMSGYVPGEQPRGNGVVKLNTNENPYPPAPGVKEALAAFDVGTLTKYPDFACSELRDCIAELHGVGRDQILVGNGSDEVLALCLRAFVEDDEKVGYFDPSYSLYPVLADIEGLAVSPVSLDDEFGWRMEPGYETAVFFLTCPNAPTGIVYDKETIHAFCSAFKGVVVIDEAYADFAKNDCMDFVGEFENVLVARTLSKSYSLAGVRLGYIVGPEELISALYKVKDSYNVNALTQCVGLAALKDQHYCRERIEQVVKTRERTAEALKNMGFSMTQSEANFLWVSPPMGIRAADVFEHLKKKDIYTRYFAGQRTGKYLRISVGTDEEMDGLLSNIQMMLKDA